MEGQQREIELPARVLRVNRAAPGKIIERQLNFQADRENFWSLTPNGIEDPRDRRRNALQVPGPILEPGLISKETQDKLKMHQMVGGEEAYWIRGNQRHFAGVYLDEKMTKPCHKEMKRLQELALKSKSSQKMKDGSKDGKLIYLSVSTQRGLHGIQPNKNFTDPETSQNDPIIKEMIKVSASLVANLFDIGLPPSFAELLRTRSAADGSLCAGHHDNAFTSHIQCNISPLDVHLPGAIGPGGGLHIDANNDIARLSIVMFLSHVPKDYCPGKFILPSESLYCMTAPYTAIICSGRLPHWPIPPAPYKKESTRYVAAGPVPSPSPEFAKIFRRISLVSYPEEYCMNKPSEWIRDSLLENESLFLFGTKRNQYEFWARLRAEEVKKKALENDVDLNDEHVSAIISQNSWVENGERWFPRPTPIKVILFGEEDSEREWRERKEFILKYVTCGQFAGRCRDAVLTHVEGKKDNTSLNKTNKTVPRVAKKKRIIVPEDSETDSDEKRRKRQSNRESRAKRWADRRAKRSPKQLEVLEESSEELDDGSPIKDLPGQAADFQGQTKTIQEPSYSDEEKAARARKPWAYQMEEEIALSIFSDDPSIQDGSKETTAPKVLQAGGEDVWSGAALGDDDSEISYESLEIDPGDESG